MTDGRTNGRTDIGTDRLFSENIILDRKKLLISLSKMHLTPILPLGSVTISNWTEQFFFEVESDIYGNDPCS